MSEAPENPKIIMRQLKMVQTMNDVNYKIYIPDQNNLLEIHFSVRGPLSTEYEGGWYHGKVLLPKEYPYRAPNVQMLTPSGRFELNKNLCFSFTAYHPETWSPAVGLGPIIIALQSLFDAYEERAVGMIPKVNIEEVKKLAIESQKFYCPQCNINHNTFSHNKE
ncbi:Ubiquitin-conjugating_enzyme E2 [Hexamita inflata]|uniref:Ubiquitin-conjugating enzyme E2 n=1 Tax=Hexamita inflata TaxID=28002 RepID=A0AA86TTZ2_9EUKA|nr:Ubiquitin-conjugating enzyme E2 [Hexamita inflata]CAI9928420.1 Ubiquitin-conjugating enzyme E2 [Hexamita inflata]CAI9954865.1 Ubiquitin-conjugating enzyme E2 [Hexamita inflata]